MRLPTLKVLLAALVLSSPLFAAPKHHVRHHRTRPVAASHAVVDINRANAQQLATIKGLGQKRAAAIVAYRQAHGPFSSVSSLTKVKGIGDKMLAKMKQNNPGRLQIGQ